MSIPKSALKGDSKALSEFESKQFLAPYGFPRTDEILAHSKEKAVSAACTIGFPVALKGCASHLMHKSETHMVTLGLSDETAVARAYEQLVNRPDINLDGILVQEMVPGIRELVMGLVRDPQFGACVMVGMGGVLTEIINDTAFRVAPFDQDEALDMIKELKSYAMLSSFRGQAPADLDLMCTLLRTLGRIGLENETISEIDLNPIVITPGGKIKIADALVVLENGKEPQ